MSTLPAIYALGLNHQTAPLPVRERVVFHVERLYDALRELSRSTVQSEVAILSTCNRTELYVSGRTAADQASPRSIASLLDEYHRIDPDELEP